MTDYLDSDSGRFPVNRMRHLFDEFYDRIDESSDFVEGMEPASLDDKTDCLPVNRMRYFMKEAPDTAHFFKDSVPGTASYLEDESNALEFISDSLEVIGREITTIDNYAEVVGGEIEGLFRDLGSLDRKLIMIGRTLLEIGGEEIDNLLYEVGIYMDEVRDLYRTIFRTEKGSVDILDKLVDNN